MVWFNFLKSEGFFDPKNNPQPIQVKGGFQIPYWEILTYLDKLSVQIGLGNETELTDELLAVIKNVSRNPKDNFRTWYLFIKIISNLPNERIPIEILHFIPVWLSGKFDTMLQTSELCDKLLPKFLNNEPTTADIEKAELILHYLFQVEKTETSKEILDGDSNTYHSRLYLHFLSDKFEKKDIITNIAKYCSSDAILELGRTIKYLSFNYPKRIATLLIDGEKEYEIIIHIEMENLIVSSKLKSEELIIKSSTLANWDEKDETGLKEELVSILKQQELNYIPSNDNNDIFQRLIFALNTDLTFSSGFNSIRKLDDKYSNNEDVLTVFSIIFRNILNEKANWDTEETLSLLKTLCFDEKYRSPFYKRISLYVICENWNTLKSLFWELIKGNDDLHFFSKYEYQKELYDLLSRNQHSLAKEEKDILQQIIEQGKQEDIDNQDENHKEYWQLRWYAALKDVKPFNEKYLSLSKLLNLTNEHYENLGEIKVRCGSVSPISKDNLLEMTNNEIIEYIRAFNPKDRWEDSNISGLSDAIGAAVEIQPEKFADEIELYQDVAYIYAYRIINAFGEAWRKNKSFNWEKVLLYCLYTLKSEKFHSGALKIENDTWDATAEWVMGSIAHLISDGLQNDENSFEISLLPLAKEIVQILNSNLKRVENFNGTNMDYPTYSLNSLAGKSLRALFDYSLHRARNLFQYEDTGKWEPEIKSLFENALQNGILDAYILEGMYFEQFYFLDNDWIITQVKKNYIIEEREWLAFISGFAFGKPPATNELYSIFYTHYERAIVNNVKFESFNNNGLVRHLTAFYFWKFETLSSEKLLFKFLNQSSANDIADFISYIWQQKNYQQGLTESEQHEFQKMILDLWKFIADKYESSHNEDEQNNLAMLVDWLVFAPELNDDYTALILKSCKGIDVSHTTHNLLEYLVSLKDRGNQNVSAKAIGDIFSSLNFKDYIGSLDKDLIKDLVNFLFINGQNHVAERFCNKFAYEYQQFFLRDIYEQYSNKQR